jgi:hypothetical protein
MAWHGFEREGSSYIARHWRGELTLPLSYWANNTLLSIAMMALLLSAPWRQFVEKSPRLYSAAIVGVWILLFVVTLWQAVGTWRSANTYVGAGKRRFWANTAKITLVIGLIATGKEIVFSGIPQIIEYAKLAAGRDPLGTYQVRIMRNATELEVAGSIVFGLTDDVSRALDAHPAVRIIHLNSLGGRVSEARNLRNLISAKKLTTFTGIGCYSACTLAYAAGAKRLIATDAALGFHQYAFPGAKPGDLDAVYEVDKADWLARGFTRQFIERAFMTPHTDLWKPSHNELFAAHVVTGYPDSNEVAMSGMGTLDAANAEGVDLLLQVPLFESLKTHERKTYDQLMSLIRTELQRGRSQAELRGMVLPIVQEVVMRKLPYASDQALMSFVEVIMKQMAALRSKDPALCYDYLFPAAGAAPFDATKYLSAELMRKELATMADLVRSASEEKHKPPSSAEIDQSVARVYAALSERHGDAAMRKLANPTGEPNSKDEVCGLTYDLYEFVLQLPQAESVSLLRYMFANSK